MPKGLHLFFMVLGAVCLIAYVPVMMAGSLNLFWGYLIVLAISAIGLTVLGRRREAQWRSQFYPA